MTLSAICSSYEVMPDPAKRMELIEAVIVLDVSAWDDAAAFLVRVLRTDPNPIVRHEAAFALGELRGSKFIDESICERALCDAATTDRSAVVRHEAAEALYCFPGNRAEAALKQLLSDESEDVRLTAAISLSWRREFLANNKREETLIPSLRVGPQADGEACVGLTDSANAENGLSYPLRTIP